MPDRPNAPEFATAWIADVVDSRSMPVEERQRVQEGLEGAVRDLNRRLRRRALAAPVALVSGDELQALTTADPGVLAEIARQVADSILPAAIRFGIGHGALTTEIGTRPVVSRLDGPCFHRARAALEHARGIGSWGAVEGFSPAQDAGLGALCELIGVIRGGWTETQGVYVTALRGEHGNGWRRQRDVAEAFEVSPSVVSESLKAAHAQALARAESALEGLLREFGTIAEYVDNSAS